MWDLWAKSERKPLWKLLVDLDPEFVVDCIDWRNIGDAITRSEALEILSSNRLNLERREREMLSRGPKAYCTAGWLGLSDEQILESIQKLMKQGFDSFKLKVGQDLDHDLKRIRFMNEALDDRCNLMVDANQYWGLSEAKRHLSEYQGLGLKWIEEPIARDDVLGMLSFQKSLQMLSLISPAESKPHPRLFLSNY